MRCTPASVGPGGSSRRVGASAERGRVQGPGRAEADVGPRPPDSAQPYRAEQGNLARRTRHHGRVPEVDDDQLAALRRLRAAFDPIEVVEVISDDPAATQGELIEGARMADPRRMTPEEHGEAHALLVKAVTDPDRQAANKALDELMGKRSWFIAA